MWTALLRVDALRHMDGITAYGRHYGIWTGLIYVDGPSALSRRFGDVLVLFSTASERTRVRARVGLGLGLDVSVVYLIAPGKSN